MGLVYEAEQESLRRRVALKFLPKQNSADEKYLQRFQREARAAARMHHTNIVPVFEVGQAEEWGFYAMQRIRGQGLDLVIDDLKQIRSEHSLLKSRIGSRSKVLRRSIDPADRSIAALLVAGRFGQENLADEFGSADEPSAAGATASTSATAPPSSPESDEAALRAYAETVVQESGSTVSVDSPGRGVCPFPRHHSPRY